jgi:1-acyl-sn-glycerol-3-phosphate acyltransferase
MNQTIYRLCCRGIDFVRTQCLDVRTLGLIRLRRQGPFIIACTHVSHLEPFLLSSMIDRHVRWVARTEYYRPVALRTVLNWSGAIPIQRTGQPPVRAIRSAVRSLRAGELVGIFPEGGVMRGRDAVFRGGVCKGGVATISLLAGVPILPVIMIGTEKLNSIEPWFPGRRAKLWVSVGEAIEPPACDRSTRRAARRRLVETVRERFVGLFAETLDHFALHEARIP